MSGVPQGPAVSTNVTEELSPQLCLPAHTPLCLRRLLILESQLQSVAPTLPPPSYHTILLTWRENWGQSGDVKPG